MKPIHTLALAIALTFATSAQSATAVRFQSSDADLIASTLVRSKAAALPGAHQETAPVRMSWALPAAAAISPARPFVQQSREYWTTVDAATLSKGKLLQISSAGAVIRLSPVGRAKAALLDPFAVEIYAGGQRYERGKAFANAANVAELNASGAAFSEGTVAFKLKPQIGSGPVTVALPNAQQAYLVHVFEPDSNEVLSLTTDHLVAMHGSTLRVIARMNAGENVDAIEGSMVSPSGVQAELAFKRQRDGSYVAEVQHNAVDGAGAGLWEIQAFASSKDGAVQRDARTAIASAAPRARLAGAGSSTLDQEGALHVSLGAEVAVNGRYELRGTLYGIDTKSGKLRPAAMAHAAAVLGAGAQSLELVYDAETLHKAGVRAPYQVRELTLIDQAEQSIIELRSAGLRL